MTLRRIPFGLVAAAEVEDDVEDEDGVDDDVEDKHEIDFGNGKRDVVWDLPHCLRRPGSSTHHTKQQQPLAMPLGSTRPHFTEGWTKGRSITARHLEEGEARTCQVRLKTPPRPNAWYTTCLTLMWHAKHVRSHTHTHTGHPNTQHYKRILTSCAWLSMFRRHEHASEDFTRRNSVNRKCAGVVPRPNDANWDPMWHCTPGDC